MSAGRARPTAPLAWVLTVVAGGALWCGELPLAERVPLDPATLRSDEGYAYLTPFDVALPSDADGPDASTVRLQEDGVPLRPHALHAEIRQTGAGAFSHWGDVLYLSSTDGTDPVTNGREYVALVPRELSADVTACWMGAALLALGLAWALTLVHVVLPGPRPWVRLLVLAALSVAAPVRAVELWHWGSAQDLLARGRQAGADVAEVRVGPEPARTGTRTRHLGVRPESVSFDASSTRGPAVEPVQIEVVAGAGAEVRDAGFARLPAGRMFESTTPFAMPVSEVGELMLPVSIRRGSRLLVELVGHHETEERKPFVHAVEIPVSPGEHQLLTVLDPLRLHKNRRQAVVTITGVRVGNPGHTPGAELELAIDHVLVSARGVVFGRSDHGRRAIEARWGQRPALWQSVTGVHRLAWPDGKTTRLRGAVALVGALDGTARVEVGVRHPDGTESVLEARALQGGDDWSEFDLPWDARQPGAEVLLRCTDLPVDGVVAWAGWRAIDTLRPARRVLLVLVDTLRADALGCSGNAEARTPTLDGLAADGVRFERCISQAHWTRPSMPSIMTGLYAAGTGVHTTGQQLPPAYRTLAEAFGDGGFHTVAWIANGNAGPDAGLDQGWMEMRVIYQQTGAWPDTGPLLRERVEPRLDQLVDEDLLVYLHIMEVHGPYGPEEAPEAFELPRGDLTWDPLFDRPWNPMPDAASRLALYARDVETTDAALGAFLQRFLPRWDEAGGATVVAVASDHGEFLGEDGQWGHGWHDHQPAVVHVPLLLRAPGQVAPGTVVSTTVENLDLAATLLDLVDLCPDGRFGQGHSLLPLLRPGGEHDDDVALTATSMYGSRLFSVHGNGVVLLGEDGVLQGVARGAERRSPPSFVDSVEGLLDADVAADFRDLWDGFLDRQGALRASLWTGGDESLRTIDPAALEQLRELGYLGH